MKLLPRILVVDDQKPMRASISQCLLAEGFRVLEAVDGAQGLEMIARETPDLIILDVMMPKLTGLEVAAELRRLGRRTPILMLTTMGEVAQKVAGLEAGADDYLTKPFDRRELLARVQALLRRQTFEKEEKPFPCSGLVLWKWIWENAWRIAKGWPCL